MCLVLAPFLDRLSISSSCLIGSARRNPLLPVLYIIRGTSLSLIPCYRHRYVCTLAPAIAPSGNAGYVIGEARVWAPALRISRLFAPPLFSFPPLFLFLHVHDRQKQRRNIPKSNSSYPDNSTQRMFPDPSPNSCDPIANCPRQKYHQSTRRVLPQTSSGSFLPFVSGTLQLTNRKDTNANPAKMK